MGKYWFLKYDFPASFPTDPLSWSDEKFDSLFIRTRIYDDVDVYLNNIVKQYGKFWVSSPSGGYGKSTMLNYISRTLYKKVSEWRAIPFHLRISEKLYDSVKHTFIMEFLKQLSRLDEEFERARRILKLDLPDEIEKLVIKGYDKYKAGVEKFRQDLPRLSPKELENKFYLALDKALGTWIETGYFKKYVLLIDEMISLILTTFYHS